MKRALVLCVLLAMATAPQVVAAAVPQTMSYQGVLQDGSGNNVPDGSYSLNFRIYNVAVGGSSLWFEAQTVSVVDGIFDVILGSTTPLTLAFDAPYWLGIQVGADPELTPRMEMTSAAYSLNAQHAETVEISGLGGDGLVEDGTELDVNPGTGLEVAGDEVGLTTPYANGSAYDGVFVNEGQAGSVTSGMIAPDVVSSVDGVSNDAGDVDLVEGANITITPNDSANTITIAAAGGGDISGVTAGNGLVGGGTSGDVTLDVSTATGLQVVGDAVQLTTPYASGSAYNGVFVNEGQTNGVTAGMIAPDVVGSVDGVSNDAGNIDLLPGSNITITPNDTANTITIAATGVGDITAVDAGAGLGGGGSVGAVTVNVNTGTGIQVSSDAVALTTPYASGSAYDGVFVNEGQANSVTTGMVTPAIVSSVDGVVNDGGNVDFVAGSNMTITPNDGANTITFATNGSIGGSGTPSYLPKFTAPSTLGNSIMYESGGTIYISAASRDAKARDLETDERKDGGAFSRSRLPRQLDIHGNDTWTIYAEVSDVDGLDGEAAVFGYRTDSNAGTGYAINTTNNGVVGYSLWGDPYTFGVAGYTWGDFSNCGGVLGSDDTGSYWGSLGYRDSGGSWWGAYTPDNAYVGGTLRLPAGASSGLVLTSDASGNASWQSTPSGDITAVTAGNGLSGGGGSGAVTLHVGAGDGIDVSSSSVAVDVTDFAGTGLGESSNNLQVNTGSGLGLSGDAVYVPSGAINAGHLATNSVTPAEIATDAVGAPEIAANAVGQSEIATGGVASAEVADNTLTASDLAPGSVGFSELQDPLTLSSAWNINSTGSNALEVEYTGASGDRIAVRGESTPTDYYGIGGEFEGGYYGSRHYCYGASSSYYTALYASASAASGTKYGVYARAVGTGGTKYGVYGYAESGGTAYAGYFNGTLHATTATANVKAFKIDHPLDPANKYLYHSSVESADMMNIYNGNVELDGGGKAWVQMPDWFDALNADFRYQLTAIGAPGPNLYISEKMSGGRFQIAGGEPGMEVSWQVTGIRHDPVAEAHRIEVEQDKSAEEVGKYLTPEVYGFSATQAVDYIPPKPGESQRH
jgi:hypothetical protein